MQAFYGDLVFIVDQFLGKDEIGILDVYLTHPGGVVPKVFRIVDGKLVFPFEGRGCDYRDIIICDAS